MEITRVDSYDDKRFSQVVLNQHGAYIIGNEPYEIEIVTAGAPVRGVCSPGSGRGARAGAVR